MIGSTNGAEGNSPPNIRVMRFEDYPQVSELERRYLPESLPEAAWRSLFVNNPLWPQLKDNWAPGWVLEDAKGSIVGSITNVPAPYRFRGEQLICANGRGWVVAPEFRGYAVLLMDEYYTQPAADLFIGTSVNAHSAWAHMEYASRVPLGDWEILNYRTTHYRNFARKALEIKRVPAGRLLAPPLAAALYIRDQLVARLPGPPPDVDIASQDHFDERFDSFWREAVQRNSDKLLAERDKATLEWHYAILSRQGRLRIFTASRDGRLLAYCIAKVHHREFEIRSLRLIDYQTLEEKVDLLPGLLRAMMEYSASEGLPVMEHLGAGLPKTQYFDRGSHRLAHNWSFVYAAVSCDVKRILEDPAAWDPSEFDGDATLA